MPDGRDAKTNLPDLTTADGLVAAFGANSQDHETHERQFAIQIAQLRSTEKVVQLLANFGLRLTGVEGQIDAIEIATVT